jgi:hypothetical protein
MDCCGHGHVSAPQPWVWSTPLASIGATLADEVGPSGSTEAARTAEDASAALNVILNLSSQRKREMLLYTRARVWGSCWKRLCCAAPS